jgi:hypothetical protein
MKRLGITQEEGETMEMTLLRYLNLFKGPMSDLVIKALVALSGLDGPAMLGADCHVILPRYSRTRSGRARPSYYRGD